LPEHTNTQNGAIDTMAGEASKTRKAENRQFDAHKEKLVRGHSNLEHGQVPDSLGRVTPKGALGADLVRIHQLQMDVINDARAIGNKEVTIMKNALIKTKAGAELGEELHVAYENQLREFRDERREIHRLADFEKKVRNGTRRADVIWPALHDHLHEDTKESIQEGLDNMVVTHNAYLSIDVAKLWHGPTKQQRNFSSRASASSSSPGPSAKRRRQGPENENEVNGELEDGGGAEVEDVEQQHCGEAEFEGSPGADVKTEPRDDAYGASLPSGVNGEQPADYVASQNAPFEELQNLPGTADRTQSASPTSPDDTVLDPVPSEHSVPVKQGTLPPIEDPQLHSSAPGGDLRKDIINVEQVTHAVNEQSQNNHNVLSAPGSDLPGKSGDVKQIAQVVAEKPPKFENILSVPGSDLSEKPGVAKQAAQVAAKEDAHILSGDSGDAKQTSQAVVETPQNIHNVASASGSDSSWKPSDVDQVPATSTASKQETVKKPDVPWVPDSNAALASDTHGLSPKADSTDLKPAVITASATGRADPDVKAQAVSFIAAAPESETQGAQIAGTNTESTNTVPVSTAPVPITGNPSSGYEIDSDDSDDEPLVYGTPNEVAIAARLLRQGHH
jgi:hypothetical protein